MTRYDSFADVPAELRADLAGWTLAVADSKRLLGLRYAEWCTGAPELEADVAVSAMAQYELGHARLLRGVLNELSEDPRDESRATDPATWCSLPPLDRPAKDWVEVVALNGLVDTLLTVNMESAVQGGLRPLAQRLRKALAEEQYHAMHAAAWLDRILDGPRDLGVRLADHVRAMLPECLAFFGPAGDNALDRLAAGGILDADAAALRGRFEEAVLPVLDGRVRLEEVAVDFDGWDPRTRRRGVPDYDEASFAMLTGAHARAIGVQD